VKYWLDGGIFAAQSLPTVVKYLQKALLIASGTAID
jgi:isopentenyl diphosphate isomerase/L-lactate dehydrogenase-like FMN-dependent dehydrogenase